MKGISMLDPISEAIFQECEKRPGEAYLSPDRQKLYVVGGEGRRFLFLNDFSKMNEAEINQYIVDTLKEEEKKIKSKLN